MSGEPESFVELAEGRRLMVLAHAATGCLLFDEREGCSAYAARPLDCRQFPFDVAGAGRQPGRVRLLELVGCDYARDTPVDEAAIVRGDAQRWQELRHYQERVRAWNRGAKHRRRLGRAVGGAAEYLAFLGLR